MRLKRRQTGLVQLELAGLNNLEVLSDRHHIYQGSYTTCVMEGLRDLRERCHKLFGAEAGCYRALENVRQRLRRFFQSEGLIEQVSWQFGSEDGCRHIGAADSSLVKIDYSDCAYVVGMGFWVVGGQEQPCLALPWVSLISDLYYEQEIMGLIRLALEAILLVQAASRCSFHIFDQSFVVFLSELDRLCRLYVDVSEQQQDNDLLMKLEWLLGSGGLFSQLMQNSQLVAVPKRATSRTLVNFVQKHIPGWLSDGNDVNDRQLLAYVLDEGEYIRPQPLRGQGRRRYADTSHIYDRLPLLVKKKLAGFDEVRQWYWEYNGENLSKSLHYTYFRYNGRIYRLEFHSDLAFNGTLWPLFLRWFAGSVHWTRADLQESFSQYWADHLAKRGAKICKEYLETWKQQYGEKGSLELDSYRRLLNGYRSGGPSIWWS